MPTKHYINLTNGIEALDTLPKNEPFGFVRIQSTTLERKDWPQLFTVDVCADMLMHLALGWECVLHDRGTNRINSKTIYHGVPLIKYVLERQWYSKEPQKVILDGPRGGQGRNVVKDFSDIYEYLMNIGPVKNRIRYFGRYKNSGSVLLTGASSSTEHDGDKEFYRELLLTSYPV